MTLYWWTHWFWITIFTIFCSLQHIHTVESYPLNPPYGTKDYSKEKPLKFPLAAQTDIDDVFSTDDMILSNIFRNSKIVRHKDQLQKIGGSISSSSSSSSSSSAKIKDNVVMPPIPQPSALGEIHLQEQNKSSNESNASTVPGNVDDKIFRTKVDDVKLVNDNRSTSLISKQSSTEIVSSESEANDSMGRSAKPIGIINNATINDDNNNSTESFEESPPNNIQSIPPPSQESSASSLHSSSLLPSLPSSSSTILDPPNESSNSNSQHHEPFPFANITTEEEIIRAEIARQLDGERARKSKVLAEYRQELKFNFSADSKNLLARSATISLDDFQQQEQDESNISSEALSIQRAYVLDAGVISGICFAVVGLFSGAAMAGVVLYRRRYLNKPQALSEPDSSGYIDDSTIRDNSDEMYSLDNDSFLNSLEAMTIQNYWTDTVKHTKL